ncbi:MAG: restriction endonuclease subunit S [Phaeodactylibacter xiamenensis]|uniref:restriction endonuclease subunit S n=1 Tax=Phaeodactylibacter xiamenensis TaxID=1524460 RepID=UPI0006976503|nr:restriction endonuclease subunit S [Phaeodactylibacter xiamenensis]MCR9052992.1 restriction endonuclease subunit S [bacterium]
MTNHYDNIPSSSTQPGYKKTKLGWLPVEWEVNELANISTIQKGIAKGRKIKPGTKTSLVPYMRVANVQDGYLDLEVVKEIEVPTDEVPKYLLRKGDILLTEGGDADKLGRGTIWMNEIENCIHQNHIFAVRTNKEKLLPNILAEFTRSWQGRKYFMLSSKQSTNLASINSTQLKKLPVPLPPLPEQQKIATILSTWDRAIALTRQLLQEKEAQKKGLMQRLLTGKVRVKGFEGEWDALELGQLFSLSSGKTKPNNTRSSSTKNINKPVYGGNGIMGYTDKSLLSGGKILIGRVGEYCGCVHVANGDYWVTDNCLFTKEFYHSTSINFLAYFLDFKQLKRFRNKGGQPLISQKSILKLKFPIPQIKEQTAIAAILTQADEEIRLLREKERALQTQKKGLMQRLLTGKVRVNP